jgi:hypothetical protein
MSFWGDCALRPVFRAKIPEISPNSMGSDRNDQGEPALLFNERHLWAGLLGWPD